MVGIPEKWDPGPATPTGGTLRPGIPECLGGTRETGSPKRDPRPGTPKYLCGTRNRQNGTRDPKINI